MAEDYLKIVDAAQIQVSDLASAENKDKDRIVSYGNSYLNAFENLVSVLVKPTETYNLQNISLNNTGKESCYVPVCTCVFDTFEKQNCDAVKGVS